MTNAQLAPLSISDKKIFENLVDEIHLNSLLVEDQLTVMDLLIEAIFEDKEDSHSRAIIAQYCNINRFFIKLRKNAQKLQDLTFSETNTPSNTKNVDALRDVLKETA